MFVQKNVCRKKGVCDAKIRTDECRGHLKTSGSDLSSCLPHFHAALCRASHYVTPEEYRQRAIHVNVDVIIVQPLKRTCL